MVTILDGRRLLHRPSIPDLHFLIADFILLALNCYLPRFFRKFENVTWLKFKDFQKPKPMEENFKDFQGLEKEP